MAFYLAGASPALAVLILEEHRSFSFCCRVCPRDTSGTYAGGSELPTGFSDHVQLGRMVRSSNRLSRHAHPDRWRQPRLARFEVARHRARPFRWQGLVNAAGKGFLSSAGRMDGSRVGPRMPAQQKSRLIHYRVLDGAVGTKFSFWPRMRASEGAYRAVATDRLARFTISTRHIRWACTTPTPTSPSRPRRNCAAPPMRFPRTCC